MHTAALRLPMARPRYSNVRQSYLMDLSLGHSSADFQPSTAHFYSLYLSSSECGTAKGLLLDICPSKPSFSLNR